jgi:hypothetical protein
MAFITALGRKTPVPAANTSPRSLNANTSMEPPILSQPELTMTLYLVNMLTFISSRTNASFPTVSNKDCDLNQLGAF